MCPFTEQLHPTQTEKPHQILEGSHYRSKETRRPYQGVQH
uniref:Uncharacterized protein n=1 Tax=Arundo donax TaxID=35708 RepID=A0A0A8Y8I9_ARUDO